MERQVASAEKFYRSSNGIIGGVCAGVAEHYDTDVLLIRLLFVLLLAASLGLFGIVYLFLMLRWPSKAPGGLLYEVKPHAVDSTAFGSLSEEAISRMKNVGCRRRDDAPLSVGHTPPVPPQSFVALYGTESAPYFRYRRDARKRQDARLDTEQARQETRGDRRRSAVRISFLLIAAVFLLTVLIDFLASRLIMPLDPMACLPNFFIILGICLTLVPSKDIPVVNRVAVGIALAVLGVFGLDVSCGILSGSMLQQPLVIVTTAALIGIGVPSCFLRYSWTAVLTLFAVVAFAITVFLVYPEPGMLDTISVWLPGLGWQSFDVNPWLR